jgi:hypothetical protein
MAYSILVLGASYGLLFASKIMAAGHNVKFVCLPAEAEIINSEGFRVRLPAKACEKTIEIDSRKLPGKASAGAAAEVDPSGCDLIVLAMQEPQYRAPDVRVLLQVAARAGMPFLSIMNMPPLAYLKRIPGINYDELRAAYADASIWDSLDPTRLTLCSSDPQAIRPADEKSNVLEVTLATNFRVANFPNEKHTAVLRRLQEDIEAARYETSQGEIELPVKLKVHESIYVPLSKWPMLLTGNYRCITPNRIRTVQEAVHSNLAESRKVYSFVVDLCIALGATRTDLVSFERYAAAAQSLTRSSAAARALNSGATSIERADKLVQLIAKEKNMRDPLVDGIVSLVESRLKTNRREAA